MTVSGRKTSQKKSKASTQESQLISRIRREVRAIHRREEKIRNLTLKMTSALAGVDTKAKPLSLREKRRRNLPPMSLQLRAMSNEIRRLFIELQSVSNNLVRSRQLVAVGTSQSPGKIDVITVGDGYLATDILKDASQDQLWLIRQFFEYMDHILVGIELEIRRQLLEAQKLRRLSVYLV